MDNMKVTKEEMDRYDLLSSEYRTHEAKYRKFDLDSIEYFFLRKIMDLEAEIDRIKKDEKLNKKQSVETLAIATAKLKRRFYLQGDDAINDPLWLSHKIGDTYTMDKVKGWKIAYYPIFEDGKTGKKYDEPRALVERPLQPTGIDFREVPLRYLIRE